MSNYTLYNQDCFDVFPEIPEGSIDLVLCDPPYGTTACKWDSIIPLEPMWEQLKRVVKTNGAIVMTASQPFTTTLIASNMKMFRYCWVWEKSRPTLFQHCNKMPLKDNEDIIVYYRGCVTYNPQGIILKKTKVKRTTGGGTFGENWKSSNEYVSEYTNYPRRILKIASEGRVVHPTQKPVALMEYMIKTYTNEGETVLDFCMGSGTTGVACGNLNRNFIGIEKDTEHGYFQIAEKRISEAYA